MNLNLLVLKHRMTTMCRNCLFCLAVFVLLLDDVFTQDQPHVSMCRWKSQQKSLYCQGRNLRSIPYGIPAETVVLRLQENSIENWSKSDENLSSLKFLEQLDMYYNKLTSMPSDLPSSLKVLKLQNNQIKYVGGASLAHLTSLETLFLNHNNITDLGLSSSAFQNTNSLLVLEMKYNELTKFPENLPASLQILSLSNNKIDFISTRATKNLKQLSKLFLSGNAITLSSIEHRALAGLTSLEKLVLSQNRLTEVPINLPENLQTLRLASNNIEYLYSCETLQHGSLNTLRALTTIDLSSNRLRSVEPGTFADLTIDTIEINDNPWQCDCHLHYFIQWLKETEPTLGQISDIRCGSTFAGINLEAIKEEALQCFPKTEKQAMLEVVNAASTEVTLQWKSDFQAPDPPFVKRSVIYGPLKCKNCTITNYQDIDFTFEKNFLSIMESISTKVLVSDYENRQTDQNITIENLKPNYLYAVCVFNSQQSDRRMAESNCLIVKTLPKLIVPEPVKLKNAISLPVWVLVLCSAILLLFIFLIIIALVWKRNKTRSPTPDKYYMTGRTDRRHESYSPGLRHPLRRSEHANQSNYATNLSDRTYAECGPADANSTGQRTDCDLENGDGLEFATLMNSGTRFLSPQILIRTTGSVESDSQETSIASTIGTRLSSVHSSAVSSPTYDLLHCYKPRCQHTRSRTASLPERPPTDSGIYI